MRRIAYLLLGFMWLLVACTGTTTESVTPEPSLTIDEAPLTIDEAVTPETAVNEQAVRPQFIMFTASW